MEGHLCDRYALTVDCLVRPEIWFSLFIYSFVTRIQSRAAQSKQTFCDDGSDLNL